MIEKKSLDLDAVRAFVFVADLASFTRAADALQIAQAAVSLKIKRLEGRLGYCLLDRTPRPVQLSDRGADFIDLARELLELHDRAVSVNGKAPEARISIGISDHVAGPELPKMLQKLAAYDATISLEITIETSRQLLDAFDRGRFDAVVVRREQDENIGEVLFEESVSWLASPEFVYRKDEPLHLAAVSTSCGMRLLATKLLDNMGIKWRETFVGGGVLAVSAAISAGIAVTPLATRLSPIGTIDVSEKFNLPKLPPSQVVSKVRRTDRRREDAIKMFLATFRGPAGL